MDNIKINREHKDRLFRLLFGDEKNKSNLLSLYNAINNTHYTNADDLEIMTMQDCIYMKMKNDEVKLHLSDSFENKSVAEEFEWTATVKNINYGHNKELMENCRTLKEYAQFVDKVRRYNKELNDIRAAIDKTIQECIDEQILKDFLLAHREGESDVWGTEVDVGIGKRVQREEGREEGIMDIIAIDNWLKNTGREEEAEAIMKPENDSLRKKTQQEYATLVKGSY